jgi:hypothetical protein
MKRVNWPRMSRAVPRTGVIMRERLDHDVRAEVVSALSRLFAQGCPLPVPTQQEAMAEVGMRRWASYPRRHRGRSGARDERVDDLVKGLVEAFEADRRLVGPLVKDYECVAEAIAAVVEPTEGTP